jgi:hypothetical protein
MTKPSMICEVCQEPLAPGEEALLPEGERKVHIPPEQARVNLFKHKDPAACKPQKGHG